jgi:hypothetical protein
LETGFPFDCCSVREGLKLSITKSKAQIASGARCQNEFVGRERCADESRDPLALRGVHRIQFGECRIVT